MSTQMDTAFKRIGTEYRPGWGGEPPTRYAHPVATFRASRAYDKLIGLTIVALVAAVAGWAVVPVGVAWVALVAAFVVVLVSWFRMRWAKVLAPTYAVLEGVGLGAISSAYATLGHGIVPMAIVFTAAVFVAALALYRTGLVRVTPRMMSMAMMGAFGIMAVSVLSLFIGLPGVNSFGRFGLIFGILCIAVAVLNLFNDFAWVDRSEQAGLPADAEWASALAMLTALVLVYLSMLRILASAYGGRRS